jgi:hypothetical protein
VSASWLMVEEYAGEVTIATGSSGTANMRAM